MINGLNIVDGHIHTFSSEDVSKKIITSFNNAYNIGFELPGTATIEDVLCNMGENSIDFTVMANFAPPKVIHINNSWVLKVSNEHKNLISLVSFHPDMEGNMEGLLEGYLKNGARGIKMHPMAQGFDPNNIKLDKLYRICDEIKLPIVFHCGRVSNTRLNEYSDVDTIVPIIEKYSNIPFVLTHMADGNIDDVISLAKRFPNIYFDTSIVISGCPVILSVNEPTWTDDDTPIDVINTIGANRVIFGSDYPWGNPGHDIKRFLNMNLNSEQKELILGKNAIELFKIIL